jgi:hypothetical protein
VLLSRYLDWVPSKGFGPGVMFSHLAESCTIKVGGITGHPRCRSRYGIFEQRLHRNLLWQAADDKMNELQL